ncbi:MAG: hypothetical protein ABIJ97_04990 [Bacteroidota bacterium]
MSFRIILLFGFLSLYSFSQQEYCPLNHDIAIKLNQELNFSDSCIHTSFKPLLYSYINQHVNVDSALYGFNIKDLEIFNKSHSWLLRKLKSEDLILVDTTDFFLAINPLFHFQSGYSASDTSRLFINTRGIMVKGTIANKLSFYSDFFENQAFFPEYIHQYVLQSKVIPGQGRNRGFKGSGHDFSGASGYLSYSPKTWLNFHLGHSKNFIGEGYRSLLLSDYSYNYPFVKTSLTFNKFQYIYMLSSHQEISVSDSRLLAYQRKHGSFNYLNIIINKNIQFGLLEAVIWKSTDSTSNNNFNLNFFNPIIYTRSIQYGLNNGNNILLGFQTKIRITKHYQLYEQIILDNYSESYTGKKFGYQTGLKIFEPFNFKNLYIQLEYNNVEPYTYAHDNVLQSYTNANESLAHPNGANFNEIFGRLFYSYRDFYLDIKYIRTNIGYDYSYYHYGSDIFVSDTMATINPDDLLMDRNGLLTEITQLNLRLGYIINPRTNMQVFIECNNRAFINKTIDDKNTYIFFGIRTSLANQYYDF